jgi:hypothetical protein
MVLMFSASIYQSMTEISREGHDDRTVLSYIRTKVRNNDDAGAIYVGEFQGLPALCYDEEFFGIQFRTVVYQYDGWVYELFSEVGLEFDPLDGVRIMELDSLMFEELCDGMIKISAGEHSLIIFPRSNTAGPGSGIGAPLQGGGGVIIE